MHSNRSIRRAIPILLLSAGVSTLGGCVTYSNVKSATDATPGPNEGIVIIGAPEGSDLVFHSGDLAGKEFTADGWLPDGIVGKAEHGFLIRRLKATTGVRRYGLVSIRADRWYSPNCGQEMPVIQVQAGVVQYVGDFYFTHVDGKVRISRTSNLAAAAAAYHAVPGVESTANVV